VPYTESAVFDSNGYFEDIIGVSRIEGSQLQRIVLLFRKDAAPYVLSKPLHGSQTVVSRLSSPRRTGKGLGTGKFPAED